MKYKKYILMLLFTMVLFSADRVFALDKNIEVNSQMKLINTYDGQTYFSSLTLDSHFPILFAATDCNGLFGSKSDPNSLRSLINDIMSYFRIIVPILVISLGSIDLAKAVISSKEDDMNKAKKTFIKRLIMGVAFFFVPVFVDIVMGLADIVWGGMYSSCGL